MPESPTLTDAIKLLMQHADPLNVIVVVILSYLIRPWIRRWSFFAADNDRLLILPVLLGVPLGFLVEYTTPTFALSVAIRRSLACGCGAAVGYRFVRLFFPSEPTPPPTPDPTAAHPLDRAA